ncbi:GNAT family N-acetyltransferase [Propioniciclava sinopodophylli]|uniref:GNAT family N-acetyltransferase n=1 Tax=Propioniciclava sinopodophylli TaxID=1837344 RepID=A0A4Q9KFI1_9ACTN|nr:GNAT family N-acetyltransferase [Propioniciclava sinopodophylli]TBT86611.1 GNAT family N-acetyltransferase [Propioniciclava sinopodophylli]
MITLAVGSDLAQIVTLEEEFTDARWSARTWAEELVADRALTLVNKDRWGRLLGVATFHWLEDVADLNRVVVHPAHRREGIARRLIAAGMEWAEQVGARRVLLEVEERNSPAIRLYEDLGFMVLARRRNYYGSGLDALVMELPLESES